MIYKDFCGEKISTLGMGNMRLPKNSEGKIDWDKANEIIDYAYNNGINYFDTAFRYHDGESELFIGKALAKYPRDTWFLASKMPGHMMKYENGKLGFAGYLASENYDSIEQIFEEQLEKCGVDYFDFYLLHNVCETAYDFYTNDELGVVKYMIEQKEKGRIKHLGFSAHAMAETIDSFLNEYPNTFEFVQIQLNYLDWELQDAKSKYDILTRHGIPVIVMEPVRGGSLASLNEINEQKLKEIRANDSIASWAFRFLQSLDNVAVILSGMTTMEQIIDNIKTFNVDDPTSVEETKILFDIADSMMNMVPCTSCRYCCEACPKELNIPKQIGFYNEISNNSWTINFNRDKNDPSENPSECIGCGACQALCPQNINIPEIMSNFAEKLAKGR